MKTSFRLLLLIALVMAVIVIGGLIVVLVVVQSRHEQVIATESRAVNILNRTDQAYHLLERQRRRVAESVYTSIDYDSMRTMGTTITGIFSESILIVLPDDKQKMREICAEEQEFTTLALALPSDPTPVQVLAVQDQGEDVAQLLDSYREAHRITLNTLFSTEHEQRVVNIALIFTSGGIVLLLLLLGTFFLVQLNRSQAEAAAAHATEQLRAEFVAFAAHELRNPTSAIKTGAALLREGNLDTETHSQIVESVNRSADTLSRVVLNLLNINRIEAGELRLQRKQVSLQVLFEELLTELESYHPNMRARMQVEMPETLVNVDPEFLKLAIANLLDNAIKYSPPGSKIAVIGEESDVTITVHIQDHGTGVSPEILPHIFDKYVTSGGAPHGTHRGIGLGLYMARLLIQAHGGTIWAHSVPGEGTTISFMLNKEVNKG